MKHCSEGQRASPPRGKRFQTLAHVNTGQSGCPRFSPGHIHSVTDSSNRRVTSLTLFKEHRSHAPRGGGTEPTLSSAHPAPDDPTLRPAQPSHLHPHIPTWHSPLRLWTPRQPAPLHSPHTCAPTPLHPLQGPRPCAALTPAWPSHPCPPTLVPPHGPRPCTALTPVPSPLHGPHARAPTPLCLHTALAPLCTLAPHPAGLTPPWGQAPSGTGQTRVPSAGTSPAVGRACVRGLWGVRPQVSPEDADLPFLPCRLLNVWEAPPRGFVQRAGKEAAKHLALRRSGNELEEPSAEPASGLDAGSW